jgi:predicted lipid-binding transport protein (Tim44 family)
MATQSAGPSAFSSSYHDTYAQESWGSGAYGSSPQTVIPTAEKPPIPPGFDQKEFMRGAKAIYTRLQTSWDKRDLDDIQQFTSPEVWDEIRRQAEEDPRPGKTEIVMVNAKLLEVKAQGSETVASVMYDVLMRETRDETMAKEVREVWHFRSDEKVPGSFWVLEGIQQIED